MSRIGVLKNEPFFSGSYSFPQPKMSVKCLFFTNLVPRKVEKENHIRKDQKCEERKIKSIGKPIIYTILLKRYVVKRL